MQLLLFGTALHWLLYKVIKVGQQSSSSCMHIPLPCIHTVDHSQFTASVAVMHVLTEGHSRLHPSHQHWGGTIGIRSDTLRHWGHWRRKGTGQHVLPSRQWVHLSPISYVHICRRPFIIVCWCCMSSPSAVCRVSWSLNGPKATVKALTEKVYWAPGVRSDSTAIVVLSVVFTKTSPSANDNLSS